ncbi:hypothetical protein BRAS3843_1690013 [Bradyrhizobium sp. STM 3843]|uniref:hypothetical protein n=1 Tax=Bradyrhizobium sp. STM 3843 TaxID=551947 RepID=UPI000240AFA0|nr:hypothetical protein [Bradyrhizobium sp. STM 3843]CCE06330.1 hypothetical protein BRAS3843_1690013 [Bradyrhizobium sp. STM 3843]
MTKGLSVGRDLTDQQIDKPKKAQSWSGDLAVDALGFQQEESLVLSSICLLGQTSIDKAIGFSTTWMVADDDGQC